MVRRGSSIRSSSSASTSRSTSSWSSRRTWPRSAIDAAAACEPPVAVPGRQPVRDPVPGDPGQPARPASPTAGSKCLPAAPGRHEHLLGDVLGVSAVAEAARARVVDQGGPALIGVSETVLLARSARPAARSARVRSAASVTCSTLDHRTGVMLAVTRGSPVATAIGVVLVPAGDDPERRRAGAVENLRRRATTASRSAAHVEGPVTDRARRRRAPAVSPSPGLRACGAGPADRRRTPCCPGAHRGRRIPPGGAGRRAEAVPADPARVGRQLHLPVGGHADRDDRHSEPDPPAHHPTGGR